MSVAGDGMGIIVGAAIGGVLTLSDALPVLFHQVDGADLWVRVCLADQLVACRQSAEVRHDDRSRGACAADRGARDGCDVHEMSAGSGTHRPGAGVTRLGSHWCAPSPRVLMRVAEVLGVGGRVWLSDPMSTARYSAA